MLETVDTRWIVSGGEDNFARAIAYLSRYAANQWNQGFDNQATALNFDPANNLFAAKAILFDYNRGRQQSVYDYGHSALLLALYGNNATYFGPYEPLLVNFSNSYSYNGVSFQGIRLLPALFFYAIANDYVNKLNLGTASLSLDAVSLLSGTTLLKQMATRTGKDVLQNPRFWRAVTGVTLSAANIAVNTLLADKLAASTEGKTILEYWNTINLLYGISNIGFNLAQYQQARQAAKARLSEESSDLNNNFDSVADEFEKRIGGSGNVVNIATATKAITQQRLPSSFVEALKTFGKTEDDILEYFTKYHNERSGQKFLNDIENFITSTNDYNLTRDEVFALWGYTTNYFYRDLNTWLRNGINVSQTAEIKLLINTALNKLPNYSGTHVFRGIAIDPSQIDDFIASYANGNTKTWNDFTSCGGSLQASFGGRSDVNVIFDIQHTTAKEITNLADGIKYGVPPMPAPEVLIKAGSNFTVTATPTFDNTLQKWIIKITQIQ